MNTERTHDTTLEASYHAALRYLQRIDAREPHPRQRIKELYERARPARRDDVDGEALLDDATGTLLVTDRDRGEVVTLWQAGGGPE